MRKRVLSMDEVRAYVSSIKGDPLEVRVNKGRKKIVRYKGYVDEVYPSVFTLKINGDKNLNMLSCSYSDVICGDIVLKTH